jgi:hypothetical protein
MIGLAPPELGENSSVCSSLHLGSGFISAIINAAIGAFVAKPDRAEVGEELGKTLVADGWQEPAFGGLLES